MAGKRKCNMWGLLLLLAAISFGVCKEVAYASDDTSDVVSSATVNFSNKNGGGYAITNQIEGEGYGMELYNSSNGLPTSDASYVFSDSKGYIWIGSYSGIIRYDGISFDRMDPSGGMTSGKVIFEDSKGRIWIGTNDNGVVVWDGVSSIHFTYKDGLPSSTIRTFAEEEDGTIYVGTTCGICYVDEDMNLSVIDDYAINTEYVMRLMTGADGIIYGNSRDGNIFSLKNREVVSYYSGSGLGVGAVTALYADAEHPGKVFIGNGKGELYYGDFGSKSTEMEMIDVSPALAMNWISYECGRLWIVAETVVGYLDEKNRFVYIEDLPLDSTIEMITEDYQGNLWLASTRQGVAKIVSNNFDDITKEAGIDGEVVNTTCIYKGNLYIGTDSGLRAIDKNYNVINNAITDYLKDVRIRCIITDNDNNLWIATYGSSFGLVCFKNDRSIVSYNEENGFLSNSVRCLKLSKKGSVLVGTNGGAAILNDGKITRIVSKRTGMDQTVCLTIDEDQDGRILIGTDGGGIYVVDGKDMYNIGREDGLTSDVILRIKMDEQRGLSWIITSNSIEYMRDGEIKEITGFPYPNNYDIYFDDLGNAWILSSIGIYFANADEMIEKENFEYKLYTTANGLTSVPTGNSFSQIDDEGNLYISGRRGVYKVNINSFHRQINSIKVGVKRIMCNDKEILPDAGGNYVIPARASRIQISAAILNYTLTNPLIHMYLEGDIDSGITANQTDLSALEFTGLKYGNYKLHIQILDEASHEIYQDEIFSVEKKPRFTELWAVRLMMAVLLAAFTGFLVWRIMTWTIIRRQYKEIAAAKDEAERANSAKSRFLANMSHEIRTPINTIMGMDEMILREDATGAPKAYFMSIMNYAFDIKTASESLLGLVNDILDISKIESGKMHLVEQEYSPEEEIRSMIKMIRVRSEQKDLSFGVEIDENIPKRLYGDKGKIKQVTLNLLTNAVKYTEKGGFVLRVNVLEKNTEKCKLRFSVKDTGIGVREEDIGKLFNAFERLDEERNSAIQGTGLGLDISRQFAELMNGELKCESVYGEGSDFIFIVEQKIVDPTPIGEFKEQNEEFTVGPYKPSFIAPDASVLVVDDNIMNLSVIKGLLAATKIRVVTATSGEECLKKLAEDRFDVILLDHMMPGMDGIETLGKIREKYEDVPVYALTANADGEGGGFYESKGFDGYLAKPIDPVLLEKTIRKHLADDVVKDTDIEDEPDFNDRLSDEYEWLYDIDELSVSDGIKYSGGIEGYIFSLKLFRETIQENAETIEKAYNDNDIKLFTIKVHSLKSAARIVGAFDLSEKFRLMEEAGKKEDITYINDNIAELLDYYRSFWDKLYKVAMMETSVNIDKKEVSREELQDAYEAIKEMVPQMEFDGIKMVIDELNNSEIPENEKSFVEELEKALKRFDWDRMEELFREKK